MQHRKIIAAIALVILFITTGAFTSGISQKGKFKNLQVLPQDISEHSLDSIMKSYNVALDVGCEFCHKNGNGGEVDWASDDNKVKETGRNMMRLTIDINKKYFNTDSTVHPAYLNVVTCNTCHKGNAYPQ